MIEEADRMTVQAANSLLKFLEEPLSACVIILSPKMAKPYCRPIDPGFQTIHLLPLSASEMEQRLVRTRLEARTGKNCSETDVRRRSGCRSWLSKNGLRKFANKRYN